MPLFPTPTPHGTDAFLKDDVEIRIAEKTTEVPNWFTGKKTYIGLVITFTGIFLSRFFKVDLPAQEISNFLALLEQNWDLLVQIVGGAVMIIGLIAKKFRHEKEVEVVKEVAKEAIVETAVAAVVVAEVKKDLVVKEIELVKMGNALSEAKQQ